MSLMSSSSRGTSKRFGSYGRRDVGYRQRSSGFTLVEMIVAVAIVGIIAAVVYSSLWGVTRTIEDAREKMELHQAARYILWRMSEEISNAFINERNSFTGSDAESNDYDSDSISFISTSKASGPEQQGTCRIEYYIVEETLFKSVDGTLSAIIEDADDLDLSYFDGTDWREDWDSNLEGRLPKMIEVNLWLKGEPFSVTVSVPLTKVYEK